MISTYELHFKIHRDDTARLKAHVKRQGFSSIAEMIRSLVSSHLEVNGEARLRYCGKIRSACRRGHAFSKDNILYLTQKGKRVRTCRTCYNIMARARYQRVKERKIA